MHWLPSVFCFALRQKAFVLKIYKKEKNLLAISGVNCEKCKYLFVTREKKYKRKYSNSNLIVVELSVAGSFEF